LSCTEEFYKKNVIEHLKSKKVSPEEAKKMQKVLEKNKDKNELGTKNILNDFLLNVFE
jgi:hypothetical protein